MSAPHATRGRTPAAASLFALALIAGCSSPSQELVGPAASALPDAPASLQAQPPLFERWRAPRVSLWLEGGRRFQATGYTLETSNVFDLAVPADQSLTFHWSARPKSGQAETHWTSWSLDNPDVTDLTPRLDDDDLAHWSDRSATVTSATVGPFEAGSTHEFLVMASDTFGFLSLIVVRMQVGEAGAVATRR